MSFSDPERQQTFVPGGRVLRPAGGELRGSGLSEASVEPPGRVDVCLNVIGLRQMSLFSGMILCSWTPAFARDGHVVERYT